MDAVLLPGMIFLAEMCVVTLGTLRIIFVSRGQKFMAPCLGFFEIVIWLFAISQVMQHLQNVWCFLAFAGGFTIGNYFGILIEKALAMGLAQVSIVAPNGSEYLVAELRARDFGVTCVSGNGAQGPVQIVFTVVRRRQLKEVLTLVENAQPGAFYAVDEVTAVSDGIFPMAGRGPKVVPAALRTLLRRREAMMSEPGV
jgi:uncharacterized protein YebE (UPF0316 family)